MHPILVWDLPVRLGHWLMVAAFALCWLTAESESLRLLHIAAGGVLLAAASFRIVWGWIGTPYARFRDFVHGPRAVKQYLASLLRLQPHNTLGHNPAGGWAIVGLLALGLGTALSGWAMYAELAGHWLEELHEGLASLMLTLVLIHVLGVISGSLLHQENLVSAMINGRKSGPAEAAITSPAYWASAVLLVWMTAVVFWLIRS